jgi:hypothetical protein
MATWSNAGRLDWWVKERQQWWVGYAVQMAVSGGSKLVIFVVARTSNLWLKLRGNTQLQQPNTTYSTGRDIAANPG